MKNLIFCVCILFSFFDLDADEYEGIGMFANYQKIDLSWLPQFLPYNPVIVEAGAFYGNDTCQAAKIWPKGHIYAFEPNPEAFEKLKIRVQEEGLNNVELFPLALNLYNGMATLNVCCGMNGLEPAFGYASSLLPLKREMEVYCKGPQINVPCTVLDDWCQTNAIHQIDILKLELEGMELPILKSSSDILKNVKIIMVKTHMHPHRFGMTDYLELKNFLEKSEFVLLSHWYKSGIDGHAIFLSRELFDAYFKLSLGMYLDV